MHEKDFFDDLIKAHSPAATEPDSHSEEQDEGVPHMPTEPSSEPRDVETTALLPHEARRALVYLLRQGSALARQKSEIFELICRYQDSLRNHLENMYLRLVIDERYGVAFIANAHNDEDDDGEAEVLYVS